MISETRLARGYASFWRGVAPTMELFVKRCNQDLYDRHFEPINSTVDPDRRAIVNLFAFELFCLVAASNVAAGNLTTVLSGNELLTSAASELNVEADELGQQELAEARELARRMWFYFHIPSHSEITVKPIFQGCGIVLSCVGDALVRPGIIVEMKDGDRAYRSYEFRQISIYAALYYNQNHVIPDRLEVLNSRRGTVISVAMEDFSREVAGHSASTYLYNIIRMMSDSTSSQ